MLMNESKKRFRKVFYYIFRFWDFLNFELTLIRRRYFLLFRHLWLEKLHLNKFGVIINFFRLSSRNNFLIFFKVVNIIFRVSFFIPLVIVHKVTWKLTSLICRDGSNVLKQVFLIMQEFIDQFSLGINYTYKLFGDLVVKLWLGNVHLWKSSRTQIINFYTVE